MAATRRWRRSCRARACWRRKPISARVRSCAAPASGCARRCRGLGRGRHRARDGARAASSPGRDGLAPGAMPAPRNVRRPDCDAAHAAPKVARCGRRPAIEAALGDESVDAVIAIGGTGSGRGDASVRTLARLRPRRGARDRAGAGPDRGLRRRREQTGAAGARPPRFRAGGVAGDWPAPVARGCRRPATRAGGDRHAHAQGRVRAWDGGSRAGALPRRQGRAHSLRLLAGAGDRAGRRMDLWCRPTAKVFRPAPRSW